MAETYVPPAEGEVRSGSDGKGYRAQVNNASGVVVWVPQTYDKKTDKNVDDPSRSTYIEPLQNMASAPKDLSGVRNVEMNGPQGPGKYAVVYGKDGQPSSSSPPAFIGADVNIKGGDSIQVLDGVMYKVTKDANNRLVGSPTPLTDGSGKELEYEGILDRGKGQLLTGAAAAAKAPAQALQALGSAYKNFLGPTWQEYEPAIQQIAADPTMDDDQKTQTIEGIVAQAAMAARSGMTAYNRGLLRARADTEARAQADVRAQASSSLMKDFVGAIQNVGKPMSGDQVGSAFQALLQMSKQSQHDLGGDPVPLGQGSVGQPLGAALPQHWQAATEAATQFANKYGMDIGDAADMLNTGFSKGFDSIQAKLPELAAMKTPLSTTSDTAATVAKLGAGGTPPPKPQPQTGVAAQASGAVPVGPNPEVGAYNPADAMNALKSLTGGTA